MDGVDKLLSKLLDSVPMSEHEVWMLKNYLVLGGMMYAIGSERLYDIEDCIECADDESVANYAFDFMDVFRQVLHAEQTRV